MTTEQDEYDERMIHRHMASLRRNQQGPGPADGIYRDAQGRRLPKVTFGRPVLSNLSGIVNVRDVFVDGKRVGTLAGIRPSPHNEGRPTAFHFYTDADRAARGDRLIYSRFEEARSAIAQRFAKDVS